MLHIQHLLSTILVSHYSELQPADPAFCRLNNSGANVSPSTSSKEIFMNDADPRVKRTRKLLEDSFVALLGEKGFHAISVQDIAERATVNRATFYAHFEDKYALMDQMIRDAFREALGQRVAADASFTLG